MPKRKRNQNNDYKGKKSFRFTQKDHIKTPKATQLEIVDDSEKKDTWKGRSHPKKRMDYVTGNYYKFKVQQKFKQLCGDRRIGLFTLSDIETINVTKQIS